MASFNYIAAIGRFMMAAIFLASGFNKFLTPAATQAYIASAGLPDPVAVYWATTVVELTGGAFLLLGVATRFAALVLAGFALAAALVFHTHLTDQNQFNHFMKNLAMAGGLLQVVAFGSGGFAITHRRRR
ncbi:MAG: DoxX family protein [Rhodomicrobium sp.]